MMKVFMLLGDLDIKKEDKLSDKAVAYKEKIDALTQSVWGVSNNELTEIVYKIDKLKQQLKLIK